MTTLSLPTASAWYFRIQLDAEIAAAQGFSCMEAAAASSERIKHQIAGLGERLDQGQKRREGFFGGMQLVAAVHEVNHVADGVRRLFRVALRQQIRAFMLVTQMAGSGGIALQEYQMADNTEACGFPGGHEAVDMRPAVETDAEAVAGKDTIYFGKGRFQPGVVIIVFETSASTVFVAYQVRRVGQAEVNASSLELGQDLQAIATNDGIGDVGEQCGIHRLISFLCC